MMKVSVRSMKTNMRIGIWQHWFKMEYHLGMMLRELGLDVADVDYRKKGYLEDLDILIINQNAVNDCIENARSLTQGGGNTVISSPMVNGITNVIDSLIIKLRRDGLISISH